jgi:hypothetical protein
MPNRAPAKTDILQATLDIMVLKTRLCAITAAGCRERASEKADWERTASIMHTLLNDPR